MVAQGARHQHHRAHGGDEQHREAVQHQVQPAGDGDGNESLQPGERAAVDLAGRIGSLQPDGSRRGLDAGGPIERQASVLIGVDVGVGRQPGPDGQQRGADLQDRAVVHPGGALEASGADPGAVGGSEVLNGPTALSGKETGVAPGHRLVREDQAGGRVPSDDDFRAVQLHRSPGVGTGDDGQVLYWLGSWRPGRGPLVVTGRSRTGVHDDAVPQATISHTPGAGQRLAVQPVWTRRHFLQGGGHITDRAIGVSVDGQVNAVSRAGAQQRHL